jgi:hypothetical protein
VLGAQRQVLHARTAAAIEELYRHRLDTQYGELARHYDRTDNAAKAVEYLRLAGVQAADRGAHEEAVALERICRAPGSWRSSFSSPRESPAIQWAS